MYMRFRVVDRILGLSEERREKLVNQMIEDCDLRDSEVRLSLYALSLKDHCLTHRDKLEELFGWSKKKSTEVIRMVQELGIIDIVGTNDIVKDIK